MSVCVCVCVPPFQINSSVLPNAFIEFPMASIGFQMTLKTKLTLYYAQRSANNWSCFISEMITYEDNTPTLMSPMVVVVAVAEPAVVTRLAGWHWLCLDSVQYWYWTPDRDPPLRHIPAAAQLQLSRNRFSCQLHYKIVIQQRHRQPRLLATRTCPATKTIEILYVL